MYPTASTIKLAPGKGMDTLIVNGLAARVLLFLLACYIPTAMGAVITDDGPTMRLEDVYSFNATAMDSTATITWSVDRKVNNTVRTNFFTAAGPSATFNLDWVSGNTTYIIRAEDSGEEDEIQIQVFPPGRGISYTFENPYRSSPSIMVRVLVPSNLNSDTSMISVHHGSSRANYFAYWSNWGEQN